MLILRQTQNIYLQRAMFEHLLLCITREVVAATSSHLKRYYFGLLKLDVHHVMLSMLTATDLSPDLVLVKKSLGIPLVKFADAQVDLGESFNINYVIVISDQHWSLLSAITSNKYVFGGSVKNYLKAMCLGFTH